MKILPIITVYNDMCLYTGHALMQMAEIYKEMQHQADDNVSEIIICLLV